MNKFASVLAAIALAATSSASSAVEETTDKRNAHRTQASKHHTDAMKTYTREGKADSA
jgi:Ni/Co efflux regulator RcnB